MANNTQQIRIESILGGQSAYVNYASEGEFLHSYNIDIDLSSGFTQSDGVISPAGISLIDNEFTTNPIMWLLTLPKKSHVGLESNFMYAYDAVGCLYYSYTAPSVLDFSAISELNGEGTSSGNGACYYDNYLYFAKDTTVARYGPFPGTSPMPKEIDYWTTTLGFPALSNTTYPIYNVTQNIKLPNHPMIRHTDGALYFADVVGNQGVLHKICTKKTTVEGDTNNGSAYAVVDFPYGMWPTALASYGTDVAVALYEGSNDEHGYQTRAKISFWNPTNTQTYDSLTSVEFPDPLIYALLNTNGILYVFSGQINKTGVRVTRFAGGYTYEQIAYIDHAYPPLAGAVDGFMNKVLFGGLTTEPNPQTSDGQQIPANSYMTGCVWSIGSKKDPVSMSLFNVMGCGSTTASTAVTAMKIMRQIGMDSVQPVVAWSAGTTTGADTTSFSKGQFYPADLGGGSLTLNASYGPPSAWRSQVYKIGQRFKITKISIPFAQRFVYGDGKAGLTVGVLRDGGDRASNYVRLGDFVGSTEYTNRLVIRPNNLVCDYRFVLELVFTSTDQSPYPRVSLPILIDYEIIND